MIVFLMTSYDFESISYERECIFNSLLKKMIDIIMFCYNSKAFHFENEYVFFINIFVLIETIVFLLISYDFDSYSYEFE